MALNTLRITPHYDHRCANLGGPSLCFFNEMTANATSSTTLRHDEANNLCSETGLQHFGCMRLHPPCDLPVENRDYHDLLPPIRDPAETTSDLFRVRRIA